MEKNVQADGEQYIHGAVSLGISGPEFIFMRSPLSTLICSARHDYFFDIGGAWDTFRRAKEFYGLEGFPERVDLVESIASHGFSPTLRTGAARWMRRWLMGIDDAVTEREDEPILSDREAQVTAEGEVMLIAGARSSYDINADYEKELALERRKFWAKTPTADALAEVRRITGIRKLEELPKAGVIGAGRIARDGYRIDRLTIRIEPDLWLPALAFVPQQLSGEAYLYLHAEGKHVDAQPGGPIEQLVGQDHIVMAVDLRGLGETQAIEPAATAEHTRLLGHGWSDMFLAYQLQKSYLAFRAEDVLICARALAEYETRKQPPHRVHLVSIGRVGPPALHAAALKPQLFDSVTLTNCLASWVSVIQTPIATRQLENAVRGALKTYDLPDLVATLPSATTRVIDPLDAEDGPADPTDK